MELSLDDDISSWSFSASSVAYFLIYSDKNEVVHSEKMKSSATLASSSVSIHCSIHRRSRLGVLVLRAVSYQVSEAFNYHAI